MTIVFFKARAQFTAPISYAFWRKLRKHQAPFHHITALGGAQTGYFQGSLSVEDVDKNDPEALAYEVSSAIVQKVELLSKVGVAHIEFEEVTAGISEMRHGH